MNRLAFIFFPLALSACSPSQDAAVTAAAPIVVQTAEAIDPAISPAVAKACVLVTAATSAAVVVAPTSAQAQTDKGLSDASCGTPAAQKALTVKDKAPVTPTNSGNSANWLLTTVLPDALAAAKIAVAVAPLL